MKTQMLEIFIDDNGDAMALCDYCEGEGKKLDSITGARVVCPICLGYKGNPIAYYFED
jgi:hypothetical protein